MGIRKSPDPSHHVPDSTHTKKGLWALARKSTFHPASPESALCRRGPTEAPSDTERCGSTWSGTESDPDPELCPRLRLGASHPLSATLTWREACWRRQSLEMGQVASGMVKPSQLCSCWQISLHTCGSPSP